jgi:hypothetical protein
MATKTSILKIKAERLVTVKEVKQGGNCSRIFNLIRQLI